MAEVPGNASLKENSNASSVDITEPSEFSPMAMKCLHCHKFYISSEILKEHIQLGHPERAFGYSSLQCNAAFLNREQLDKHELQQSPNAQMVSWHLFWLINNIN